MEQFHDERVRDALARGLTIDCGACCGLCCVALYIFKSGKGLSKDKPAGTPCKNLTSDCRCAVHGALGELGLAACRAYDCLGAGQQLTRALGPDGWSGRTELVTDAFQTLSQLHQMLWYLGEGRSLLPARPLWPKLDRLLQETGELCRLSPEKLAVLDPGGHRMRVNGLLRECWALVQAQTGAQSSGKDFFGKDFRRADLRGRDFSTALLIGSRLDGCRLAGANLLGADLRDASLSGADLRECLFLTQMQLNMSHGDLSTLLPPHLTRPEHWGKTN